MTTPLREELADVLAALVAASDDTREVSLDAIGDAIGTRAITPDEIDALLVALEARGIRVVGPEGGGGEERLRRVVRSARALGLALGRRPTLAEIAAHAGLTDAEVRHALALAKVMQR